MLLRLMYVMAVDCLDIQDGETWGGYPAMPIDRFYRQMRTLQRIVRGDVVMRGPGSTKEGPDGE